MAQAIIGSRIPVVPTNLVQEKIHSLFYAGFSANGNKPISNIQKIDFINELAPLILNLTEFITNLQKEKISQTIYISFILDEPSNMRVITNKILKYNMGLSLFIQDYRVGECIAYLEVLSRHYNTKFETQSVNDLDGNFHRLDVNTISVPSKIIAALIACFAIKLDIPLIYYRNKSLFLPNYAILTAKSIAGLISKN